jgi:adenine/guanine phosphoribosyltransferase-like PRPP-binding protein
VRSEAEVVDSPLQTLLLCVDQLLNNRRFAIVDDTIADGIIRITSA